MWSSWFNGYSSTFTIEGDSLAVLKVGSLENSGKKIGGIFVANYLGVIRRHHNPHEAMKQDLFQGGCWKHMWFLVGFKSWKNWEKIWVYKAHAINEAVFVVVMPLLGKMTHCEWYSWTRLKQPPCRECMHYHPHTGSSGTSFAITVDFMLLQVKQFYMVY